MTNKDADDYYMQQLRNHMNQGTGEYIGDGVYVYFDGYHVWLNTTDGYTVTNRIALNPRALDNFLTYAENLKEKKDEAC